MSTEESVFFPQREADEKKERMLFRTAFAVRGKQRGREDGILFYLFLFLCMPLSPLPSLSLPPSPYPALPLLELVVQVHKGETGFIAQSRRIGATLGQGLNTLHHGLFHGRTKNLLFFLLLVLLL